jgi:SWI/SNF-related matrix-associated actin-dependent regulator of chromatin subfamily A member 5
MPRKSAAKAEEPSSEDVSAHSDVDMQDQQEDKMSGFKKFGVSATWPGAFLRHERRLRCTLNIR